MVPQIFRSRIFFVTAFALAVLLIGTIYSVKQPSETVPEGDVSIDEAIEMRVAPSEEIASSEASDIGVASPAEESTPAPIEVNETAVSSAPLVTIEILLISLIALSFVALVVSLWVNVFLLKWRRTASAGDLSIIPSELLGKVDKNAAQQITALNEQIETLNGLASQQSSFLSHIQQETGEIRSASDEVLKAFSGLQKALNQKDAEIERLRGGYDSELFRRFLSRFLKLEKIVGEEIEDLASDDSKTFETLTEIQTLLKDALAECGLESFSPELGASIRDAFGVENSKQRPAEHAEQVFTIAEVIEPGWRIRTPEGFDCVKEARVVVYVEATPVEEVA